MDISPHIEARIQAIEAYQSQFDGAVQAGEVFPGGERPLADQIRAQLAHYGSLIRVAYGEPYCVDEVLEVGDLADLGVSSF